MIIQWTSHLKSEEEIKRFKQDVINSKPVLDRLTDLLNIQEEVLTSSEISPKIYDLPNWDYKQAHTNGFRAALKMVKKIINLDQKEHNEQSIRPE